MPLVYPGPIVPKRKSDNPPAFTAAQQFDIQAKASLAQTLKQKNTDFKKQLAISDKARAAMVAADKQIAIQTAALQTNPSNSAALAALQVANAERTKQENIFNAASVSIKSLVADIAALEQILKPAKTVTPKKTSASNSVPVVNGDGAVKPPFKYTYNAPMVKSAYFGSFGVQADSAGSSALSTPGFYKDGRNAFQTTSGPSAITGVLAGTQQGAKGTIQMSQFIAQTVKLTESQKKNPLFDTKMYGFKFLYNPNTVNMSWGVVTDINPQLEAMGLDKSVSLTSALSSTINFQLVLNRIDDLNILDVNGIKTSVGTNPYPSVVDINELKTIYKKGTMYDLEYLFKTINGFSSTYKSGLNGNTADWGWLYAIPVELHLGDGLRYLVRISSLDVEHKIFNERMVPTYSLINITCARYPDVANQQTTSK